MAPKTLEMAISSRKAERNPLPEGFRAGLVNYRANIRVQEFGIQKRPVFTESTLSKERHFLQDRFRALVCAY